MVDDDNNKKEELIVDDAGWPIVADQGKQTIRILCCICQENDIGPYGNNAEPIVKNGLCCDECNFKFVIRARVYIGNIIKKDEL